MQGKTPEPTRKLYAHLSTPAAWQPLHSAATSQDDPSRLPLTPRGQATSKVSHPGGDCNGNFL